MDCMDPFLQLLWEHDLYVNAMQTSRSCRELLQLLMVISRFQSLPRLQEAMRQWSEIPSFSDLLRFRPARMVLRALLASTAVREIKQLYRLSWSHLEADRWVSVLLCG